MVVLVASSVAVHWYPLLYPTRRVVAFEVYTGGPFVLCFGRDHPVGKFRSMTMVLEHLRLADGLVAHLWERARLSVGRETCTLFGSGCLHAPDGGRTA